MFSKPIPSREYALQLDQNDALGSSIRDLFQLPPNHIYMLGNSLGLPNKKYQEVLKKVVFDPWKAIGVEAFFDLGPELSWMPYVKSIRNLMAPIVGAQVQEVVPMNTLTINLHCMLASFYKPSGKRTKILIQKKSFPSDVYAIRSFVKLLGYDPDKEIIEICSQQNQNKPINEKEIYETIEKHKNELALILFGGVNYYTGQVLNMKEIAKRGKSAGAMVGFDLAHAAGNIKIELSKWEVDFAVWCTYKYLNGGPMAIGFAYVNKKYHNDPNINILSGWWGCSERERFKMSTRITPESSALAWQVSCPSILHIVILKTSLQIYHQAGWQSVLAKSRKMISYSNMLMESLNPNQVTCITPTSQQKRGNQLSLFFHVKGRETYDFLMSKGIIIDWREPQVIRFAVNPLYNTFEDLWVVFNRINTFLNPS